MRATGTRPWRRLATQRAARRRGTALLPPPDGWTEEPLPLPPLESPDDDREFLLQALPEQGLRAQAA
jgi:hypothetical protein